MNSARVLLGVAAALAAIAAFGTASASATNLCSEKQTAANECPVGKAYGVGQVFEATSTNAVLETELLGAIACEESTLKFKVTKLFAEAPVQTELLTFSFGKCKGAGGKPCTLEFSPLPARVRVKQTAGGNGEVFVEDPEPAQVVLKLTCEGLPVEYTVKEIVGKLTGGNGATIVFAQALEGGGAAGEGELKGTYTTTNPKPVWVAK